MIVASDATRVRVGRAMAVVAIVSALVGVGLYVGAGLAAEMYGGWVLHNGLGGVALGLVFYVTVARQPRNGAVWAVGWSALLQGVLQTLLIGITGVMTFDRYGREFVDELPQIPDVPASLHILGWVQQWSWIPALGLLLTFGLLLFPNGRLPSPRWRWAGRLAAVALTVSTLATASVTELVSFDTAFPARYAAGLALLAAAIVVSIGSVVVRYRRADGEERHQIRWVGLGVGLLATAALATLYVDPAVFQAVSLAVLPLVVLSMAVAILKYRLYDIDLVISRALTYGVLAGFITVVYVGIVVGIGTLAGQGDRVNIWLSVLATVVVAIAFQPVRRRVQLVANRVVYGTRATPYETLAGFSRGAADMTDEELIARVPQLVVDGTGAAAATLWVRAGDGFRAAGSWPEGEVTDQGSDHVLPIHHDGELLGKLALAKARGETITPQEQGLLASLASGLGLALRNARLTERLRRQVEELEESRDRVVAAADEARRSLEQALDSGPQQQLVALKVKLGPVRMMAERAGAGRTAEVLAQLDEAAGQTIRAVRDFAGGVYPPLLEAEGLEVALGQQARRAPQPIGLAAEGVGRYPREVEAAVYFTVLEALQNAAKYAQASRVDVALDGRGGRLVFEVRDDGVGFDPRSAPAGAGLTNMADRLDAVGGTLTVESAPGEGTVVRGGVPLGAAALV